MGEVTCSKCGSTVTHAEANILDRLRTCGGEEVVRYAALGPVEDGEKHDWEEA